MSRSTGYWKNFAARLVIVSLCALGQTDNVALGQEEDERVQQALEAVQFKGTAQLEQLANRLKLEMQLIRETQQLVLERSEGTKLKAMEQLAQLISPPDEATAPLMTAGDVDANSLLIRNCLTELQRIQWEEATEEGLIKQETSSTVPASLEHERVKLKSAINIAQLEIEHLQNKYQSIRALRDKATVSESELREASLKVKQSEMVLQGLMSELQMLEESAKAASSAPIVAAKQRLAQLRSRRQVVLEQLKQLQARHLDLKIIQFSEQSLNRVLEQAHRLREQSVPMQLKSIETQALLNTIEQEVESRKRNETRPDDSQPTDKSTSPK